MKLIDMNVERYIMELGSDSPAPGGGTASALCGAQGAALISMVAGLTIGKKKYEEYQMLCMDVLISAAKYREKLVEQVDKDTEAFLTLSNAFKLPKATEEEKSARSLAIQKGTLLSTQVPFATMEYGMEAMKLALQLVDKSNATAASDLGVAALSLQSCVWGAWLNVQINLGSLKDEAAVRRFREEGLKIQEEAAALCNEIVTRVSANM